MPTPYITIQFAEYTVYTDFAIPNIEERNMTENTNPRKVAAKPAAKRTAAPRRTATTKTAVAVSEKKVKKEKKIDSKIKVVRDSFTMPQSDYDLIAEIKQKMLKTGLHVKKSELLRAGLHVLSKQTAAQLKQTVASLEKIKTGRPKKT
jgi:hypothetical protein